MGLLIKRAGEAFDAVVCGGGLIGVSCAHYLARSHGAKVLLVDQRPFLSHTSALSTECYRNYWSSHAPMTAFMNRSIDLLEARAAESANVFSMNRRGYCFLTATEKGKARHLNEASMMKRTGLGTARVLTSAEQVAIYRHDRAFDAQVDGLCVLSGSEAVRSFFEPLGQFVSPDVQSVLFCGRCGWMNAQQVAALLDAIAWSSCPRFRASAIVTQMGSYLLESARGSGVSTCCPASVVGVGVSGASLSSVRLATRDGTRELSCGAFVNCAGPFASSVHRLLLAHLGGAASCSEELHLPLRNEVHAKAVLRDRLAAVPRAAPMMIWEDEIDLEWTEEEREELRRMGGWEASLADPLCGGAHFRPYEGGEPALLLLWEALHLDVAVTDPPPDQPQLRDELFVELMLRGLRHMVPRLADYLAEGQSLRSIARVDGGYYTKTPDNLPLIGPVADGPAGAFVCAGLSGYGVMAANGAGELLAKHVAGAPLPEYASDFLPERWLRSEYRALVQSGTAQKGLQI